MQEAYVVEAPLARLALTIINIMMMLKIFVPALLYSNSWASVLMLGQLSPKFGSESNTFRHIHQIFINI